MANPFHTLAEWMARIEHKLDLLLTKNAVLFGVPKVGDALHTCPLCQLPVTYLVDPMQKMLMRRCGCGTGLQAPIDLEAYAPPMKKGKPNGGAAELDGYDGDPEGPGRR